MITIRRAKLSDAETIIDFQQRMAWETERLTLDPDVLRQGVNSVFTNVNCGQYWVAEADGLVIASLLITYEWSDWRNSNVWWFQSVYVLPPLRRKGIFRAMFVRIKAEAEKQGVAGLRLYVETSNYTAQQTYEAMGMESKHYKMYEWLK
ncbi:MAG TPA: GNAT family N-acetyltransferase [Bacteroidales bacterium]|nr:GNAT family N-acetyltransferase [Bacteroidales bacterium]